VLDFAGNVARHGPIDAVNPHEPGAGGGEPPVKICPDCRSILPAATRTCPDCGHAFPPPEPKIEATASSLAVLSSGKSDWVRVSTIGYRRHEKPGRPPSLRVDYHCGLVLHREWICIEHSGFPREKAVAWWRRRAPDLPVPMTVDDALARTERLRVPAEIAVRPSGRFTEVVDARFS
jgi:DNA repair protein RadD